MVHHNGGGDFLISPEDRHRRIKDIFMGPVERFYFDDLIERSFALTNGPGQGPFFGFYPFAGVRPPTFILAELVEAYVSDPAPNFLCGGVPGGDPPILVTD